MRNCCFMETEKNGRRRKELIAAIVTECVVKGARVSEPKERPPPVRLLGSLALFV